MKRSSSSSMIVLAALICLSGCSTPAVDNTPASPPSPPPQVQAGSVPSNAPAAVPSADPSAQGSQAVPSTATPTPPAASVEAAADGKALSNDNHYVNSRGNTIHSPADTKDGSVPDGATAVCRDGTYSFSQSHRGTCSHHGGVERWLD